METPCEDEYTCLSFNSYSSNKLITEIAVKVAAENNTDDDDDDEDFEFSLVRDDFSADEFAYDAQIGSIFPLFNRDLLRGEIEPLETRINVTLGKLLFRDRINDDDGDNFSSETEELENIPAGSCCVWRPKSADQPSPSRCIKSRSAGSASKRWKVRDLLRRSNSEGKDSFVFLTPKNREEKVAVEIPKKGKAKGDDAGSKSLARSAHEALYVRNRAIKEGDKKKSYLPYRRDLVGFFVNGNVFSKSSTHF